MRVRRHVPADADALLQGRYQIVNLWRPIGHPALDFPLALCDYRSVDAARDLVAGKLVFATYEGETKEDVGAAWADEASRARRCYDEFVATRSRVVRVSIVLVAAYRARWGR